MLIFIFSIGFNENEQIRVIQMETKSMIVSVFMILFTYTSVLESIKGRNKCLILQNTEFDKARKFYVYVCLHSNWRNFLSQKLRLTLSIT
jgi:hypothetical protein